MGEEEDQGLADFRRNVSLEVRHQVGLAFEAAKTAPVRGRLDETDKDPAAYVRRYSSRDGPR